MPRRMKSRVTTAQGDKGQTRAISGEWLSKSDIIIECTGCVDSVRAKLAELRLQIMAEKSGIDRLALTETLFWLLHMCFLIGTEVNDPTAAHPEYRRETVGEKHLKKLELAQRSLEKKIDFPKSFIVSASSLIAARADICATDARTLERRIVALKEQVPDFDETHILPFVNRLSDYIYVLARHLEDGVHLAVDYTTLDES